MSTVKNVKDFVSEFYEVLNEIIEYNGTLIKLYKRKIYIGYNDVEITADVSVEVFDTPKQYQDNKPTSVFIFVCWSKDFIMKQFEYYEIVTKFMQSELEHKLYIVSQKGFSQEVVIDCSFDKVGLIMFPRGSLFSDFIVPRILEKEEREELMDTLKGKYDAINEVICYDNELAIPFADVFFNNNIPIKQKFRLKIPYKEKSEIESYVNKLILRCGWSLKILDNLMEEYKISSIIRKKIGNRRSGYFNMTQSQIYISNGLSREAYRFELAHELGIYFLHRDILHQKLIALDEEGSSIKKLLLCGEDIKKMKQQANLFASYLLMPEREIKPIIDKLFGICDIRGGHMFVDDQDCNMENYSVVIPLVAGSLQVTKLALSYRLMTMGLMEITDKAKKFFGI